MKAPGQSDRTGISLIQLFQMFPDDDAAEAFFVASRWPDGPRCPHCDSDNVQAGASHPTMPMRCRACRKRFSARTGTAMADSKLGYRVWAIAIYLVTTNLKGVSSMKLSRDLEITQKTAWHLAHRIRQAWTEHGDDLLTGPVEVDEAFVGGREANRHEWQRDQHGPAPKVAVVGVKDRATGTVRAKVIGQTHGPVLRHFVRENAAPGAQLYSDGHSAYLPLDGEYAHKAVQHSAGTYALPGGVSTNGIESFWSMLRRGEHGTYHHWSAKHLQRYVDEFAGRHRMRPRDTIDQMRAVVRGLAGTRLQYRELTA